MAFSKKRAAFAAIALGSLITSGGALAAEHVKKYIGHLPTDPATNTTLIKDKEGNTLTLVFGSSSMENCGLGAIAITVGADEVIPALALRHGEGKIDAKTAELVSSSCKSKDFLLEPEA